MEENSLRAYKELKDSGLLSSRQIAVYHTILEHPNSTDREIAEWLEEEDSNYVRPRRRELVKLGIIEKSGNKICSISYKTAGTWIKKKYDLNKLLEQAENKNQKNSSWWWNKVKEQEKRLSLLKENYFKALFREEKQTNLGEFKK
jgi:hypothetical protein